MERAKRTLYEIGDDLLALEAALYEMGGDITDEEVEKAFDEYFASLGAERNRKIDGYCHLIREFEARADARREEIKRLESGAKVCENATDRLKKRLKGFMDGQQLAKLETGHFTLSVARNGGKAPLLLPDQWKKEPTAAPKDFQRIVVELDTEVVREKLAKAEMLCPDCGKPVAMDAEEEGTAQPAKLSCVNCYWEGAPSDLVRLGERGTHLRIK